jgi:micrococcal nuclease
MGVGVEDYVRNALVVRVIDGDTLVLDIDLGFNLSYECRVRVLGVNCPEVHGPTKDAGLRAKQFTAGWCAANPAVTVKTYVGNNFDDFGRVLAEVWRGESSLGADLLASGNAAAFVRDMSDSSGWF